MRPSEQPGEDETIVTTEANEAGSRTAMSARIFRSSVTPAAFSPLMS